MKRFLAVFIAIIIPVAFFYYFDYLNSFDLIGARHKLKLPHYHPLPSDASQDHKVTINDTTWHSIPEFDFNTVSNKTIGNDVFDDKIAIISFFDVFDEKSIAVNKQLQRVQKEYRDNPSVVILSHLLLAATDTPTVDIDNYIAPFEVDSTRWLFMVKEISLMNTWSEVAYKLKSRDEAITKLVLVDRDKTIRGYYNGTNPTDVNQLMVDVKILQLEYPIVDRKKIELNRERSIKDRATYKEKQ